MYTDRSELVRSAIEKARIEATAAKKKATADTTKKFVVGQKYSMTSICDHNCVWTYTVIARTAATITITDGVKVQKCRVIKAATAYRNAETIYPLGQYSLAPSLTA